VICTRTTACTHCLERWSRSGLRPCGWLRAATSFAQRCPRARHRSRRPHRQLPGRRPLKIVAPFLTGIAQVIGTSTRRDCRNRCSIALSHPFQFKRQNERGAVTDHAVALRLLSAKDAKRYSTPLRRRHECLGLRPRSATSPGLPPPLDTAACHEFLRALAGQPTTIRLRQTPPPTYGACHSARQRHPPRP